MSQGPQREIPQDLSKSAVKAARRLQALSDGAYLLLLVKVRGKWLLVVERLGKVEHL